MSAGCAPGCLVRTKNSGWAADRSDHSSIEGRLETAEVIQNMFRSLIASSVVGCITIVGLATSTTRGIAARATSSQQAGSAHSTGLKTLTRQNRFSNEPVEITSISVNGQSVRLRNKPVRLTEGNDWLRGLVVRFKNVTDRPISAVEFHLAVAEPGYLTTLITFTLKYGLTPSSLNPGATELLMPGATAEVALSATWYDQAKLSHAQGRASSIALADHADLALSYVYFGDRTAWHEGSLTQIN